jgi:hypothetical protein
MIRWRGALARASAAACMTGAAGCSGASHAASSPSGALSAEHPLKLDPLVDLVPAAGLAWLVDLRPTEIAGSPALAPAVAMVLPAERFEAFARRHGGVDLRQASEVAVAGFSDVTLALARLPVDPPRIEKAFDDRAAAVEGRAVEHGVTRLWGTVGETREQVAIFEHAAVGLEQGRFGPLRVATYFAEGRLKRSPQALHADPLLKAAEHLGDAPLRGFAPGPFVGEWADGLGGLLRAATAVGASLVPTTSPDGSGAAKLTVVVMGQWGDDAAGAAQRLAAAFNLLAEDPLGRLAELNRPKDGPHVVGNATEVRLEVILDPTALARGVRDATSAAATDIVASPRRAP